jgi:thiamine-phosphate pyrophosphorylase
MLKLPRLYPILDTTTLTRLNFPALETARIFLDSGVQILQFRHKSPWTTETFDLATQIAELCHQSKIPFILNDRADYALALRSGLHVGQDDLLPADARTVIGPAPILGYSAHNPAQLAAPETQPADYLAFGPVFPTASKENPDPQVGLAGLKAARTITVKPLVAIGGVTRDKAFFCWEAGADAVAVIADLLPQPLNRQTLRQRVAEWIQLSAPDVNHAGK